MNTEGVINFKFYGWNFINEPCDYIVETEILGIYSEEYIQHGCHYKDYITCILSGVMFDEVYHNDI